MLASILASGLAAGAIYALVGVTYNTMFSTSRVMSFTAGQLAMLGGVFGSMFTLKMGMPIFVGFLLTLLGCAIIGVITEFVAVRPVLKSLDQHLYVLSTLAVALMIQQVAAIKWGTEPQPFPRLFGWGSGVWDEKFWLPVVACAVTIDSTGRGVPSGSSSTGSTEESTGVMAGMTTSSSDPTENPCARNYIPGSPSSTEGSNA